MINFDDTYWERIKGYPISEETRIDARWLLRNKYDDKPYGSLRIVSHPDLQPGYLRSVFIYVTKKDDKPDNEIIRTIEDNKIDLREIELYELDKDIETETIIHTDSLQRLEKMFNIEIM